MKLVCPHCQTPVEVADERVRRPSGRILCPRCGQVIPTAEDDASGEGAAAPAPGAVPGASSAPPASRGENAPSRGPPRLPRPAPAIPRAARVPSLGKGLFHAGAAEPAPHSGKSGSGALVGAFRKIVDGRVATALVMPDHDWFVGMGEVIVGPMSLADLRIRAGRGAVTAASLVWREGFDDWQPLGGFPEVLAVLQDAVDPGRPDPPVLAERPSVAAPGELGSPFEGAAPPSEIPGVRRGPSLNGVLAAAVAGSLLLGFGAGFLWFGHGPAAATADTGAASPVERPGNRVAVGFDEASRVAPDVSSRHDPGTQGPPPGGASEVGGPILGSQPARDPTTRRGLESLAAPRAPTAATSAALAADPARAGGQPLEEGQVQRTVSRQAGAVRRACWQPALDRRADGAPSTARVVVTIEIHPSGSVSSVTATPDPTGYPGLSACIAGRVRAWQFPPSGGGTVKVPFVFAGQ